MSDDPLLSARGLTKHYVETRGFLRRREVGRTRAVDGIDLDLRRGEALGLIGETGCGKSTAARTMLRLEAPTGGTVRFDGEDVTAYDDGDLRRFRRRTGMIFQDPTSSFDPRMTVGASVEEPLAVNGLRDRERRRAVAEDLLERVGLDPADYGRYPHELSGGQKQRAALARALVVDPDLLVADEPVSALDVSVQATVLALLSELRDALDLSVLLISHDMSVVRQVCDRVAVMYLGEIVERGPTGAVLRDPAHPYTRALAAAVPTPDPDAARREATLGGDPPDASDPPDGCRFHPRCPAIVPPDGYDLDPDAWRRLLDFRAAIERDAVDLGTIEEFVDDPRAAIRAHHDLPDLDDPDAAAVLDDVLAATVDGDLDAALDRFDRAFDTVCARVAPDDHEPAAGRSAACHWHDPDRGPPPWRAGE